MRFATTSSKHETVHDPAAIQARNERRERMTELAAAFILSIAALLSSYAGFQAQLWDGEEAASYALAEQARTKAAGAATVAVEINTRDHLLFSQWLNAYASGDARLEAFYRQRFRPRFQGPFTEWLATHPRTNPNAPASPFSMPSYDAAGAPDTERLEASSVSYFQRGQRANDISDAYVQATVVLALGLFIGGIIQAFKAHPLRVGLLSVAAMVCLAAAVRIADLPALRLL